MAPSGNHDRGNSPRDRREDWRAIMRPLGDASPTDVARMILKRAGITPLLTVLGFALLLRPAHGMAEEGVHAVPHAQAQARARIVTAQATISHGTLSHTGSTRTERGPTDMASRIERACGPTDQQVDPTAGTANAGTPTTPGCTINIYDMP